MDLEKKEVTRNCGVKTLDGSETWGKESLTRTNTSLFYLSLTSSIFAKAGKCLSDKLSYNYNIYSTDEEGIRIDANGNLQISILKSKLATDNVTGFKTWLVSNNVTVVYQLATPITEDIEVSSNTLTDFTTSCTLTVDNTIKGNIECNEVVGLIPSIEEDETRLANVEKSLENKAEKNHNHDTNYLKLSGGTITDNVDFANGKGIHGKDSKGTNQRMIVVGADDCCYLGSPSIRTYIRSSDCPQYLDGSGNKYDIYYSGNFNPSNYLPLTGGNVSGNIILNNIIKISSKDKGGTVRDLIWMNNATNGEVVVGGGTNQVTFDIPSPNSLKIWCDGTQKSYEVYHSGNFSKDITTLFERNNGTINKNINTCFNSSSGNFTAPEAGQYLVMCSGYELSSSSSEYIACVLDGSSSNQNKLYTKGSSGFTLITLSKGQTLAIYTATAGNMNKTCISVNSIVNMLIARIN